MIYLIHFERKLHHAQHYIGYTNEIDSRMKRHSDGFGSKLMKAVKQNNINWQVVRTWEGNKELERKLKRQKNSKRFCPVCIKTRGN